MAYVKIKFGQTLWVTEADNLSMYTIGYFLTDDVMYAGGKEAIGWILDERYKRTCSNATFMEKYDGNIAVGDLFTEDPCEAAISVPIPVMIDLLQQWDVVCTINPDAVIIYYENEKFRIEVKKKEA
jgi:hypothetical protein